jgi:DNA-binding CsgD family transcriptional regulator
MTATPNGWQRPDRVLDARTLLRSLAVDRPYLVAFHPVAGPLIRPFRPRDRRTIGRAPWCDLVIDWDDAVSRAHAVVEAFGPLLTVEPLAAATNAPRVDDRDITERTPLADGARLVLGTTTVHVRLPAGGSLSETARVESPAVATPPVQLTAAQRRVAAALRAEPTLTNRELGERLGIAHETVRSHVRTLLARARAMQQTGDDTAVDRTTVAGVLHAAGQWDESPSDDT